MDADFAATVSKWAAESNSAMCIQLVSGETVEGILRALDTDLSQDAEEEDDSEEEEGGADVIQFHPTFTYPIYGEHERVFGYKGLRISLSYAAGSLATYFDVGYKKRIDEMESSLPVQLRADDVDTPMRTKLSPAAICATKEEFARRVARDTREFRPLGRKAHEYSRDSEEGQVAYEIYESDFVSGEFREYHRRMQTLVLFYIEGAQFIDDSDDRWRVFTVFERLVIGGVTSFTLVGFCTMYQFYNWPDRRRPRISQFLVLPPFQGQGHGSELYRHIYQTVLRTLEYADLTVEDPSEAFDDMRDRNDMRYLLQQDAFAGLEAPVSPATLRQMQERYKISKRQMTRCVEMGLLKSLDKARQKDQYEEYRLFVKRRIYAQNTDLLAGLDDDEKKKKVAESFAAVEDDYHRILSLL
ncbi:histone acetyltransferase 1 [Coemansia aciculifera]|uniref:Histone acetyltransferase 1 n=1 Tax=Coemansia aciculifera TaxID=417176 RepID=A0ACC1MAA4_9FUNG|nr:histone acetyltransferase 1 [Coemansia aciculifera]